MQPNNAQNFSAEVLAGSAHGLNGGKQSGVTQCQEVEISHMNCAFFK